MNTVFDLVVIGSGIIGLSCARAFLNHNPGSSVLILEKEDSPSLHASTRNSGVLHAGFYYSKDSLKARFCRDGNHALKKFCKEHSIPVDECGKVIVARNLEEIDALEKLYQQGLQNQVPLEWISSRELQDLEPLARTFQKAIFSPSTAVVNPHLVCEALVKELERKGCIFSYGSFVQRIEKKCVTTSKGEIAFHRLINAAGLYADQFWENPDHLKRYMLVPFKGFYLGSKRTTQRIRTNIYPVPHSTNAFLGVHLTRGYNGEIKIGPSAFPAFWRENYRGMHRFRFDEFLELVPFYLNSFLRNSFQFRSLAWEQWQKGFSSQLLKEARSLVSELSGEFHWLKAGIRAQLVDLEKRELVSDFLVERQGQTLHILNSVSPGFTCSLPFGEYLISLFDENN